MKNKLFNRVISLALALVMVCGMVILLPTTAKADPLETAEFKAPANGHRDIFIHTAVGSMPEGFETNGTWSVIEGDAIDNWGGQYELDVDPTKNPYYSSSMDYYVSTNQVFWNHFLTHNDGSAFAVYKGEYTDFDFTTHIMIPDQDSTGAVVFRYKDEKNYYFVRLTTGTNNVDIGKVEDGTETVLTTGAVNNWDEPGDPMVINPGTWYNLRIQAEGNELTARITRYPYYINLKETTQAQWDFGPLEGNKIGTVTDNTFSSGKVGYWDSNEGTSARYSVFAVSNTASDVTLENDTYKVTVGSYGQIKELYLKSEPNVNFVVNEESHRDSVGPNQFLGELRFTYKVGDQTYTATTGESESNRTIRLEDNKITVTYEKSESGVGRHFTVTETYSLVNDHIQFDIQITAGDEDVEILDLGLPVSWNNHWQFQSPYQEYASAAGNYVSYNGSWVQLECAGGGGSKLLFMPDQSTNAKFEYRKYMSNQQSFGAPPEVYYIFSQGVKEEGQGYLESTSLNLAKNTEEKFSFQFYATDSYLDTENTLYEAGSLDVQVNPGMVLPDDITALVDIHTSKEIKGVKLLTAGKSAEITAPTDSSDGHHVYSIKFANQGRNDVEITYDNDKSSVLQFWVTDSVKDAMQAHVDFLMNTLRITEPENPHLYSFGEYNNKTSEVDKWNVGTNHCSNNDYEQMYDGPAFIAEKNVYYPVQDEITAMDQYLIDLVYAKQIIKDESSPFYGRLYHGCCDAVCWGDQWNQLYYDGHTVCQRVYNPARIYNTFFSMYKVASYYPQFDFRWDARDYLYWAGMIACWGTEISGTTGTMGEQTTGDIIEALRKEGFDDVANRLYNAAKEKADAISKEPFPFGSEFSVDRTGEEGAYFNSKLFGHTESAEKAINKIMAWISKVPTWYWQTTGRTNDADWWIFQYTVSLQAAALKDYYFTDENAEDYWSMIYPSAFSSFVHIKTSNTDQSELLGPEGTVWWNYRPTTPYNWDTGWPNNQTGEADIDLWGGLQILSTDVVLNDPSFGVTAYGGTAKEENGLYTVTPQDGINRRVNVVGMGAKIELQSDGITTAKFKTNSDKSALTELTLTLDNALKTVHDGKLTVTGLAAGSYELTVNGTRQSTATVKSGEEVQFSYQLHGTDAADVKITPIELLPEVTTVALVGDEALNGEGTSDWTKKGTAAQLTELLDEKEYTVKTFDTDDLDGVKAAAPGAVVLMPDALANAKSYEELITKYLDLDSKPVIYAVTDAASADLAKYMRDAAFAKSVIVIDAEAIAKAEGDVLQKSELNNNGAYLLAVELYDAITGQVAPVRAPIDGTQPIDATEYTRQKGAEYIFVKETGTEVREPHVSVAANGYIGFENVDLGGMTATSVKVDARTDIEGAIKIYNGKPGEGGKLVGQLTVSPSAHWVSLPVQLMSIPTTATIAAVTGKGVNGELLRLTGSVDIYLEPTVEMEIRSVTLTEAEPIDGAPVITEQPHSVTTYETRTAQFNVTAVAAEAGQVLAYQWQTSPEGVNWTDISGATGSSYETPELKLEDSGKYYRVEVYVDGKPELYVMSEMALLTVTEMPTVESVTVTPATATVRAGGSQNFYAVVSGTNNPPQGVTWTVTDGAEIDADGYLVVDEDAEVGTEITVTATSTFDTSKSGTATVTVSEPINGEEDIVLHYIFNENNGNSVTDHSKNSYTGTINGEPNWQPDGLKLENGAYVEVKNAKLLSSNMTLIYKVKLTSGYYSGTNSIFWGKAADPGANWANNGLWVNITDGNAANVCADGGDTTGLFQSASDFYTRGEWVEVAISINSDTGVCNIYRNGEYAGTAYDKHVTPIEDGANYIGAAGSQGNEAMHDFVLGEYLIFDEALTQSEAKAVLDGKFAVKTGDVTYESVTVTPDKADVGKGGEQSFSATVNGENGPKQDVVWSIEGEHADDTTISENGLLHVSANEAETTLTIRATSTETFENNYAEAEVTVHEPEYQSVTVIPGTATVRKGDAAMFRAVVNGQYLPVGVHEVTWSVEGVEGTTITDDGILIISPDETADTLTVTATSVDDPKVTGTATVTVTEYTPATEEDIVLHYEFANGSGTTVEDKSKNHYDGTINGEAIWNKNGLAFNGHTYIAPSGAEGAHADLVSPTMTLIYQVKRTGELGANSVFWGKNGWADNGIWINMADGGVFVCTDGFGDPGATFTATGDDFYPMNTWTEIAITVDTTTGNYAIYRNCELVTSGTGAHVTADENAFNFIGATNEYYGESLAGMTMGKYMIFNKALTASDVAEYYTEPVYSSDTSIASVDIDGTPAKASEDGSKYTITLPYGSDMPTLRHINVTTVDPDASYEVERTDEEGVFTITVTSEGGTTATYTLTVTIADPGSYTLTVKETEHGKVTVEPEKETYFAFKDTVTLTFEPDKGYELISLDIDGIDFAYQVKGSTYEFEMPDRNVVITVTFGKTAHTVSFDANGGTGTMDSVTVEDGADYKLPRCTFTVPRGKVFSSWALDAEGKNKVTKLTHVTEDITVYAIWKTTGSTNPTPGGDTKPGSGSTAPSDSYPVKTPSKGPDNGSVSTDVPSAKPGEKVTVTVKPDEGFITGGVTVTDGNGNSITVTDNGDGTYTFVMPKGEVNVNASFITPGQRFRDLDDGAWYRNAVAYVINRGLMNGVGEGIFNPDGITTRGMVATILWRIEGKPAAKTAPNFTDVKTGAYYYDAVAWAAENGVVKGYGDGKFGPDDEIDRQQLMTMIYNYASKGTKPTSTPSFPDFDSVADWAKEGAAWCVENGIINGSDGRLDPTGNALRTQLAKVIMELCLKLGK